jgi:hypothetical protein
MKSSLLRRAFVFAGAICLMGGYATAEPSVALPERSSSSAIVAEAERALDRLNRDPVDREEFLKAVEHKDDASAMALLNKYEFPTVPDVSFQLQKTVIASPNREHMCGKIVGGGKGPKGTQITIKQVPCPS